MSVCSSVLDDKEQISLVYKVTNSFIFSPEGEIFVCLQKGEVLKVFFALLTTQWLNTLSSTNLLCMTRTVHPFHQRVHL